MSAPARFQRPVRDPAGGAAGPGPGATDPPVRSSSRSSVVSAPPMPPIAENEVPYRASRGPGGAIMPRTPLRVPRKSSRRALQARSVPEVTVPAPPPYVPVTHLPPQYKEPSAPSSDSSSGDFKPAQAGVPPSPPLPPTTGPRGQQEKLSLRDRQWFGSRRKRWCMFLGLGFLVIGIIAGLAVGLTLGLRNRSSDGKKPPFPEGSYSFETTLQRSSSSCASNPSAWRCYPYTTGSNATFFWVIDRADDGSSYTVSSDENPFVPPFDKLSTRILDADRPEERLVFEFHMNKTVVPSDALSATDRAANCTFGGTKFQATLWTKRGSDDKSPQGQTGFGRWPADVEIVQSKESEPGEPKCEDGGGNVIADVQAGAGDCSCDYASFEL